MKKNIKTILLCTLSILMGLTSSDTYAQGFYKDLFMDAGIKLNSLTDLPAARRLGLSMERYTSSKGTKSNPLTIQDTLVQNALFIGSEQDLNGVLLYPDGAPRFRAIFVNGGASVDHGRSLGSEGRDRVRAFFDNGGSYVGTCAGMFLATMSAYSRKKGVIEEYFHLWPGYTFHTGLSKSSTGLTVEKGSKLLDYYDFGGDLYIDSVRHNGGGFIYTPFTVPEGTEILLRYNYLPLTGKKKDRNIDGEAAAWGWKSSDKSGRVSVIGSHPEAVAEGERLDLMSALILYALDGVGSPVVKAELVKGEARVMDKGSQDNEPAFTKIGDKQYHHFTVIIPKGAKGITFELEGAQGYDLNLYLRKGGFAFVQDANHMDIAKGASKSLRFDSLEEGEWFVAVECDTTVETKEEEWGVSYTGNIEVLNGVPYTIKTNWELL